MHNSEYGKLRCCAYTPIDYCKFDDNGDIIPYDVESGFDCPYSAQAIYEGVMGTEEEGYKFIIPTINGVDVNTQVTDNLLNIAKEAIIKRNYQIINK